MNSIYVCIDENNASLAEREASLHNPASISVKAHYFHHHVRVKEPEPTCNCPGTYMYMAGPISPGLCRRDLGPNCPAPTGINLPIVSDVTSVGLGGLSPPNEAEAPLN